MAGLAENRVIAVCRKLKERTCETRKQINLQQLTLFWGCFRWFPQAADAKQGVRCSENGREL